VPGSSSSWASSSFSLSILALCLAGHRLHRKAAFGRPVVVACHAEAEAKETVKEKEPESKVEDSAEEEKVKEGEDDEDAVEQEEEDEAEEVEAEQKPQKWNCIDCGTLNFAQSDDCSKCGAGRPAPEVAQLVEEKKQAQDKVSKVMDDFIRLQADLQNYRRDHTEAMSRAQANGKQDALKKLLPISEDIQAAIVEPEGLDEKDKAIFDSYSLLFRKVNDVWSKTGVQPMDAEVGEAVDPAKHIVVEERQVEEGQRPGTVFEVLRSGWKCDGKTVLPSKVIAIAEDKKAEEKKAEEEEAEEDDEASEDVDEKAPDVKEEKSAA